MSWAAIGIGGASLLGGVISGAGASSAADTAAQANISNTNATNAANLNLFNLGRGGINPATGYGNAILPQYFGANETNSANDVYAQFQALMGANNANTPQLQGQLSQLQPSLQASMQALQGQFNGQNLSQQLGFAAPVYGANMGLAQTTGQGLQNVAHANTNAINSGLAATLAQLNSSNVANGFLGNSSFNNNRMLGATVGAHQQAAVGQAQANASAQQYMMQAMLQNAQNTQGLRSQNLQGMMNTGLIPQGLSAYAGALNVPSTTASNNTLTAQQMLNFYKLQPQSFQMAPLPYQSPAISGGQIFGSALSAGAGAGGGMYMNQQMLNAMRPQAQPQPTNPYGGFGGTNPFATNPLSGYSPSLTANPYAASTSNQLF